MRGLVRGVVEGWRGSISLCIFLHTLSSQKSLLLLYVDWRTERVTSLHSQ